jgi:hypothetical protein
MFILTITKLFIYSYDSGRIRGDYNYAIKTGIKA